MTNFMYWQISGMVNSPLFDFSNRSHLQVLIINLTIEQSFDQPDICLDRLTCFFYLFNCRSYLRVLLWSIWSIWHLIALAKVNLTFLAAVVLQPALESIRMPDRRSWGRADKAQLRKRAKHRFLTKSKIWIQNTSLKHIRMKMVIIWLIYVYGGEGAQVRSRTIWIKKCNNYLKHVWI